MLCWAAAKNTHTKMLSVQCALSWYARIYVPTMLCAYREWRDASMHRDTWLAPRTVSRPIELADRQTWKYINIRISSDIRRVQPNNVFYSSPRPHIERTSGPVADPVPREITARQHETFSPVCKIYARCYFIP